MLRGFTSCFSKSIGISKKNSNQASHMIQLHNRVTIFPFPSLFTLLEDDIFWKTLQNQILVENQVHYNKIKTER